MFSSQLLLGLSIALFLFGIAFVQSPGKALPMPDNNGLVVKQSPHSVEETERRFLNVLDSKGLNTFITIDHGQNAEGVGLTMRPTRVVLFGNPKLGTPLMQCEQSLAIDLPQKLLIWQDDTDQVNIAYNDPRYLGGRHQLGSCSSRTIRRMAGALNKLSASAITP
ncbi:conserved domain protein [Synechococcus sp. PCC 7335]|nr:conserved domain protein [Synechococcus sp. PCC 7335]